MTGTGPELFEALGDRAARLEVGDADGVSTIRPGWILRSLNHAA